MRALARATQALYESSEPFEPYRTVNNVQRAVTLQLPYVLAAFVPHSLRIAAGKRAAQAVLASAQAQLVREAIVAWHSPRHRAVLPVPAAARAAWPRGAASVNGIRSKLSFLLTLTTFWLAGFRRFRQLARHMHSVSELPEKPYCAAISVAPDVIACAAHGGFLNWLRTGPAEAVGEGDVVAVANRRGSGETPDWLHVVPEVLPPLGGASFGFLLRGGVLLALMPLLALFGIWQGVALLQDLIELNYARRVRDDKFARTYLFLLGDQTRRPLWTFHVAERGIRAVLVFYASSYQLFGYGLKVPADIRNPSLLLNIWDECWFQTEQARADITALLSSDVRSSVIGAFDMVDRGDELPRLPARTVAIFDIEPTTSKMRLSQAGYIIPAITERVILDFWEKIVDCARVLDFVIVHKPKRYNLLQQEWRYRQLLQSVEAEGRCISLSPEFGPMRLTRHTNASVILPFTSVGDLATSENMHAFYFDVYGNILQPEKYAGGLPVAAGVDALSAMLSDCFGEASIPLKA